MTVDEVSKGAAQGIGAGGGAQGGGEIVGDFVPVAPELAGAGVEENLAAADIELTATDLAQIRAARTFANAGRPVAMLSRDKVKLDTYAAKLASPGRDARGYLVDTADPGNLRDALSCITSGCFARTRPSAVTTSTGSM